MRPLERFIIDVLLQVISVDQINSVLSDPRAVATLVGVLIAASGAWLGTFLLLRNMALTSDAISHTVLLGIVVAFLLLVQVFDREPDLSSPWLILGAAAAGVATVMLTEIIFRSGLVKADAALGLAFPFLFALAIILISGYVDNVHLDEDAVMVGEIGVAWADSNTHCLTDCESVTVTPDDDRAIMGRRCTNCAPGGISPRDADAEFEQFCLNCGAYTAAEAWGQRFVPVAPELVFWPKSLTVMGLITLVNLAFITLLYKELKLATFDAALAAALGFRPGLLHYGLMVLVSVTAVGAFNAVGSILVVAFFIIPAATAYLLTDRLSVMLVLGPLLGGVAAYTGYDLARGQLLGVINLSRVLEGLDRAIDLQGYTTWNVSISASMVLMTFVFFLLAWIASPRYGLVAQAVRRWDQRRRFARQLLLGHIYHHQGGARAASELDVRTLHTHLNWSPLHVRSVLTDARARRLVRVEDHLAHLTERGCQQVEQFLSEQRA